MSGELLRSKTFRMFIAGVLVVEAGLIYESHKPEVDRAVDAFFSNDPACSEIRPMHTDYDIIAVFGAGTYINENGIEVPNRYQRDRLRAAAGAFAAGFADEILLIDGGSKTAQDESIRLLQEVVVNLSEGKVTLDARNVRFIDNSVNSADNVSDLKLYMAVHGIKRVLGVSDTFHLNRLQLLLDNHNMSVDLAATECLSAEHVPDATPSLRRRNRSANMDAMKDKEKWAIFELALDPEGKWSISYRTLRNKINESK